jgi:hypothetical protein
VPAGSADWTVVRNFDRRLAEVATALIALLPLLTRRHHLPGAAKFRVPHKLFEKPRLLLFQNPASTTLLQEPRVAAL